MATWFEGILGRISNNGEELELAGGMNFIGFTIEFDAANNRYDISSPLASLDSDDISNASGVSGTTVSDALDALNTADGLKALASRTITAGAGLTGGGDLSADRTITVAAADGTITVNADSIQVGTIGNSNLSNNTIALARLANASAQFQIVARKTSSGGAWEDCSRSDLGLALSATTITAGTNLSGGGDLSTNRTISMSATPTGITSINGEKVAAATQGTDLTDADQTLNISTASNYLMVASTTSSARNKTAGTTGAAEGAVMSFAIYAQGHNVVIKDDGGTTLHTVTAGEKKVVDVRYDNSSSHYKLAGWKFLQ